MGKIVCRRFQARDLADILKLEAACFGDDPWPPEEFKKLLARGASAFVIGKPARAALWLRPRSRHYFEVVNVATSPKWQRKGYAKKLLVKAISFAKEQKKHGLALHVHVSNTAAVRLYESFGFKKVRRYVRYYGRKDAWRMRVRFQ